MAETCAAPGAETALVEGLMTSVDCHIGSLVQTGYGALAGQGSPVVPVLTALLTLYVALIGFRLMLGLGTLRVGDLTLSLVKIGVVLALATNWPLYHGLVFEALFNGPQQLAEGMLKAGGASGGALHNGLQYAFDEMQASAQFFAAKTPGGASPWLGGAGFSAAALTLSSVAMLATTIGVLLGLKVVLAIVLLTGPLFFGFFLFESTRGITLGWARAAVTLAFAPLFAILALVLQLQLAQPHLAQLAMLRAQGGADASPAVAILLITATTSLVTLAGGLACAALGMSLRLPGRSSRAADSATSSPIPREAPEHANFSGPERPTVHAPPPRIASVAAAAAAMERRDSRMFLEHSSRTLVTSVAAGGAEPQPGGLGGAASFNPRRAARPPVAASSLRRDR